jgi:hypothetical protein
MRIQVDQSALSRAVGAVDTAAEVIAVGRRLDLAGDIALAMPGSTSTSAAAAAAESLGDALTALVRDLARHADAMREAAARYDDTEQALRAAAASP